MSVSVEGRPLFFVLRGEEDEGIVMVSTNPRIAEVSMRELSRASLSCSTKRERNLTRGLIMYEFQRKDSSRLSISNAAVSVDLIPVRQA